jgi:hypothetical protein
LDLAQALLALEQAAAVVESYLPLELTAEQQMELLEAWGPPPRRIKSARARALQAEDWIAWIRCCAGRYEQRPTEPSVDEMHRLLLRWACASKRRRQ